MPGYFQLLTCYVKEKQKPWNIILSLSTYCFLPIFHFPGKLSRSSAAASESHSHQLISNFKVTLFFFCEIALGFPQNLQEPRFPIFKWVQLQHPSNLTCSVTPLHIILKSDSFHPVPRMHHSSFFFFFFIFCLLHLRLLCRASHHLLILNCVSSGVWPKFRTSLRYNSPKRGCEKEEGLEDLYFLLWKLNSLELEMTLPFIFLPRLKSQRN